MKNHNLFSILLLVIPLLVSLLLYPIWRISVNEDVGTNIALLTMVLDFLIFPIYLIITTYCVVVKNNFSFGVSVIIGIISLYGSIGLNYWNWGMSTGMLKTPDSSTIMVFQIETIVSTIIFGLGMFILFFVKLK